MSSVVITEYSADFTGDKSIEKFPSFYRMKRMVCLF